MYNTTLFDCQHSDFFIFLQKLLSCEGFLRSLLPTSFSEMSSCFLVFPPYLPILTNSISISKNMFQIYFALHQYSFLIFPLTVIRIHIKMIFQVCSNFNLEQIQIRKEGRQFIAFLYKDESQQSTIWQLRNPRVLIENWKKKHTLKIRKLTKKSRGDTWGQQVKRKKLKWGIIKLLSFK